MMSRCASKTPASTWMSSFGNATSRLQKNLSFPNLDTAALGLLRLLQKRGEVRVAREQRKLAAILAADVVGYSRLMGRDESGTLARLRDHRKERLEPALARGIAGLAPASRRRPT